MLNVGCYIISLCENVKKDMCILIDHRYCIKLFSIKKKNFLPTDLKKSHKVTGNDNIFFVRPYPLLR